MNDVVSEGSRKKALEQALEASLANALAGVRAEDLKAAAATLERFQTDFASAVEALRSSLREFFASDDGRVLREVARALLDDAAKAAHERALKGEVQRERPVERRRRMPARRTAALSGFADLVDLFPESRRSRALSHVDEGRRNP